MARDVLGVTVVVVQEMQQEIPAERLGGQEIEKLVNLELQPVAHLQGPPGEIDVFGLRPVRGLRFVICREGVLAHPVEVFGAPLRGVTFVARKAVGLAHRHPPFHAVQLPAQFVVLHGPVLPVDVVAIEIGGLVTFVDEEAVVHRLVGPALFVGGDDDVREVHFRTDDARAAAVVIEQGFGGGRVVARGVQCGDALQSGTGEVQQREDRGVGLRPQQGGPGGEQKRDKQFYRFHRCKGTTKRGDLLLIMANPFRNFCKGVSVLCSPMPDLSNGGLRRVFRRGFRTNLGSDSTKSKGFCTRFAFLGTISGAFAAGLW